MPPGLPRIRHYGLFAGRTKKRNLAPCRELLDIPIETLLPSAAQIQAAILPAPDTYQRCPACLIGSVIRIARITSFQQDSS